LLEGYTLALAPAFPPPVRDSRWCSKSQTGQLRNDLPSKPLGAAALFGTLPAHLVEHALKHAKQRLKRDEANPDQLL
jgi:hypothetical protein